MTARLSITFRHGIFEGWGFDLMGRAGSGRILAHVFTSVPGGRSFDELSGSIVLGPPTAPWEAAERALRESGHEPMETALAALLADASTLVKALGGTEAQQRLWGDIVTAGEMSALSWRKRYPNGRPGFEAVGSVTVDVD